MGGGEELLYIQTIVSHKAKVNMQKGSFANDNPFISKRLAKQACKTGLQNRLAKQAGFCKHVLSLVSHAFPDRVKTTFF